MMKKDNNEIKKNAFLENLEKKLHGKDNQQADDFIKKINLIHKKASGYDGKTEKELQEIVDNRIEESGGKTQEEINEKDRKEIDEQFEESTIEIREEEVMFKCMAELQNAETEYARTKIELNKKKEAVIRLRKEYDVKYGIDS